MSLDYVTQSFDHDWLQRFVHDIKQSNESIHFWINIINFFYLHNTIIWIFLNCFEWYLCIMHALNKLVSIEISFARFTWSILFEISEVLNALSAFTYLIVCFTSFSVMHELNKIVRDMNDSVMSLTFAWEDEKKNFSCSISIFFLNVIVIWSVTILATHLRW
jgi:hypothetical protein